MGQGQWLKLSTVAMNRLLKKFAIKAEIDKDITTYWLRRTFETLLAKVYHKAVQEAYRLGRLQVSMLN